LHHFLITIGSDSMLRLPPALLTRTPIECVASVKVFDVFRSKRNEWAAVLYVPHATSLPPSVMWTKQTGDHSA